MPCCDGPVVQNHLGLGVGLELGRGNFRALPPVGRGPRRLEGAEDARLDPWCMVSLGSGEWILFGFALHHAVLGGLSWMTTSPVRYINPSTGTARLANGRRYGLGRQFRLLDIAAEGLEACLTAELLLQGTGGPGETIPRMSCDPEMDRQWVTTCKMARHLGIGPPARDAVAIQTFRDLHAGTFADLRAARSGR